MRSLGLFSSLKKDSLWKHKSHLASLHGLALPPFGFEELPDKDETVWNVYCNSLARARQYARADGG